MFDTLCYWPSNILWTWRKNVIKCDLVLSIKIIYYHSNYYIVLWIRIISSHDWICFKIEPTADFLSWIVISTNRTLGDVKHMLSRFISCFRKETQEHNGQAISCRNKAEWKMRVSFVLLQKVMSNIWLPLLLVKICGD